MNAMFVISFSGAHRMPKWLPIFEKMSFSLTTADWNCFQEIEYMSVIHLGTTQSIPRKRSNLVVKVWWFWIHRGRRHQSPHTMSGSDRFYWLYECIEERAVANIQVTKNIFQHDGIINPCWYYTKLRILNIEF